MTTPAPRNWMTYGELVAWCEENGLKESLVRTLIDNGTIGIRYISNNKWRRFNADQVKRDVLEPEGKLTYNGNHPTRQH